MIREEIWWPDDLDPRGEEFVTEGNGQHKKLDAHEYTFKQNRSEVMWVCDCGRTLTRYKS